MQEKIGYANIPILCHPRRNKLVTYIKTVEQQHYNGFTSVDENLIKCITAYSNGFYWNYFDPMFAHYLTEFTRVLVKKGIIKNYLPVTSGFRSPSYAVQLAGEGRGDSIWTPHRAGIAVDILCDDYTRDRILAEAQAFGFSGLGRGNGFCHIDIGGRGSWGYEGIVPY